ncbi:MAG: N-acetylneuraminate lyase [Ruminococcaceae bacterium]|nr:N-acetylneuraminate lyase [Oscillospiraceae bacterium]
MNTDMKGIFTALLTPFDKNDNVNEKELEKLVRHNVNMGASGFYVGGSTAEAFFLSTEERKLIMDVVKDTAPEKTLIAHIGSLREKEAHELSAHANKLGYKAISSVAPFYFKFTFEEIKGYYIRLAENSDIPMLVYHFPGFSGVNMGMGEISQFLSDDRFIGIKYTSNDFFTMEQCKSRFPDKVVYNGYDEMFLCGLSMGADGGIGSTYNFMADKFVRIQKLFDEGRISEAQEVQKEANRIISILCKIGVMPAEKEVLCQLGFDFGKCRPPFSSPNEEARDLIAKEIIPYVTAL